MVCKYIVSETTKTRFTTKARVTGKETKRVDNILKYKLPALTLINASPIIMEIISFETRK